MRFCQPAVAMPSSRLSGDSPPDTTCHLPSAAGFMPIGLVRSQKSAKPLRQAGATDEQIAIGDVMDPASLRAAMQNVDSVVLCTSATPKVSLQAMAVGRDPAWWCRPELQGRAGGHVGVHDGHRDQQSLNLFLCSSYRSDRVHQPGEDDGQEALPPGARPPQVHLPPW